MDVLSGNATYPMYTTGTQAWVNAVKADYERGLITFDQLSQLYAGKVDPKTGALIPQAPGTFANILSGLGSIGNILLSAWSKKELMELEQAKQEYQLELAKYNIVHGMAGEAGVTGYGGLNVYTLAAFAGIGLLALLLLKKS